MVIDIEVKSNINLDKRFDKLLRELKKEVKVQTVGGAVWLRNDVLEAQKYVGDPDFPDVKKSTKVAKQKAGEEKVLIRKGKFVGSIDSKFERRGLVGVITGGTKYYRHLRKKWHLERLFVRKRGPRVRKRLKAAARRGLKR